MGELDKKAEAEQLAQKYWEDYCIKRATLMARAHWHLSMGAHFALESNVMAAKREAEGAMIVLKEIEELQVER